MTSPITHKRAHKDRVCVGRSSHSRRNDKEMALVSCTDGQPLRSQYLDNKLNRCTVGAVPYSLFACLLVCLFACVCVRSIGEYVCSDGLCFSACTCAPPLSRSTHANHLSLSLTFVLCHLLKRGFVLATIFADFTYACCSRNSLRYY